VLLGVLALLRIAAARIATMSLLATVLVTGAARAEDDTRLGDKYDEAKKDEEKGARAPAREATDPASQPPKKEDEDAPDERKLTLSGYVETF
jgi:hypothetical protein